MRFPPSPVHQGEADLDQGSRTSPSLEPRETLKGRVAPGHLVRASVAVPCSSSLSIGVLKHYRGTRRQRTEGGKSGSRNLQPTPDQGGGGEE